MNILVIGKFYSECFGLHIAETLTAMRHTVKRFAPGFKSVRIGGRLGLRLDQVRGMMHAENTHRLRLNLLLSTLAGNECLPTCQI